jgi:hypothetical protein
VTFPVFTNGVLQPTTFSAEVLNLTRTGRIEGRPGLRTHFFVHNTAAAQQVLRSVQFRHLGPRRPCTNCDSRQPTTDILGRWGGVHFHVSGDNNDRSLVEGTVTRDFGAHAYIPHDTNGVTFRGNIAHDGMDRPYWWDPPPDGPAGVRRTLFESNVASKIATTGNPAAINTAFWVGHGESNDSRHPTAENQITNFMRYNVAVGVDGVGYSWPEEASGAWVFDGNMAHNNRAHGMYVWQNLAVFQVHNFIAYRNGGTGISHGAYGNSAIYQDISLYDNGGRSTSVSPFDSWPDLRVIAGSLSGGPSTQFIRVAIDSGGAKPYAIRNDDTVCCADAQTYFTTLTITGYTRAAFALGPAGSGTDLWEIRGLTTSGNRYWLTSDASPRSILTDRDLVLTIRRFDRPGTWAPQWNARTTP